MKVVNDKETATALFESNKGLAKKVLDKYFDIYLESHKDEYDDIYQIAMMELWRSALIYGTDEADMYIGFEKFASNHLWYELIEYIHKDIERSNIRKISIPIRDPESKSQFKYYEDEIADNYDTIIHTIQHIFELSELPAEDNLRRSYIKDILNIIGEYNG